MDNFVQFNLVEGIFWLSAGLGLIIAFQFWPIIYRKLSVTAGALFFIFGLSDFVEIYTGGFIPGPWWLLVWKIIGGLGLIGVIVWYFILRIGDKRG